MSLESQPPGVGHTEGTELFRWLKSQEPSRYTEKPFVPRRVQPRRRHSAEGCGGGRPVGTSGPLASDTQRLGLCRLHTSSVPVPNEGHNQLNSIRSKSLRQKIPGLGKEKPHASRAWGSAQWSKVEYWQRSRLLWCLPDGSPRLLGRNVVNAID